MSTLERVEKNGIVYYRDPAIKAPHGFSTRSGGVSTRPHLAAMNMGRNLGDDPAAVEENYRRFCAVIGVEASSLVYTKQIHSADVVTVGAADAGATFTCDALVTTQRGVAVSVRTADCVPILMWSPAGVVAACRAGWRGTVAGIQRAAVGRRVELGAPPESIRCAIGAAIHQCCYEVGEDFVSEVRRLAGDAIADRYITQMNGSPHADIVGMNVEMLTQAGVPADNIAVCDRCTCHEPDVFFSHRASGGKRGVMAAIISL